jgi:DNA-binding CsgD family transcriptional regulator
VTIAAQGGEIVGRGTELAAVDRLLASATARPAGLVLEGEPGIGKTTVWRAGVARAHEQSFVVLSCRPAEAEASLSYSGLADLLRPVCASVLPALPAPQRLALEAALLERDSGDRTPDRRTVSIGVLNALRAVAADRPALLAIDDIQWLDVATRRVFEYALRRLQDERLGVLVSTRAGGGTAPRFETFDDRRIDHVRLGPLSVAALHRLLHDNVGLAISRPTLVRVHRLSGGNPFYALEIARLLADSDGGTARDRLPVPAQVKELVAARLRRLPARTREALLAAASLSRPNVEVLDAEALTAAEDSGVVSVLADGRVVFAHPLFASAVYENAAESRRRKLHRRLADLVTDPEEQGRQQALAAAGPDAHAAGRIRAAAERALARGAPDAAAELFEQAAKLATRGDVQLQCAVSAAECHLRAGDPQRARDLLADAAASATPGGLKARALWRLAEVHLYQDDFPQALTLLEQARLAADDDALAAEIELDLAYAHNSIGDMTAADPHAQEAARLAARIDLPGLLAEALGVSTMSAYLLGRGVNWPRLDRALALEDWGRPSIVLVRPTLIAALLRSWTGDLEHAEVLFDRLEQQLLDRGDEAGLVMGSFFRVASGCWHGDVATACVRADELLEQASLVGGDAMRGAALAATSVAYAYAGDAARARAAAAEALELFARVGWTVGRAWPAMALGFLELSLGDPAAAADVLSPLVGLMRKVGLAEPWAAAPFLPDAVEALVRLGQYREARELLHQLEDAAQRLDRAPALAAAARCRAILCIETGDLSAAASSIEDALAQHARVPMPIERARTLLVKGQLARRARQRRVARATLEQAVQVFEQSGAMLWAAQARGELERVRIRRPPGVDLSETERRVAELAATGLTNREVAAQLFMSPKTVEANLARAYAKLGIHSRAELGACLGSTTRERAKK